MAQDMTLTEAESGAAGVVRSFNFPNPRAFILQQPLVQTTFKNATCIRRTSTRTCRGKNPSKAYSTTTAHWIFKNIHISEAANQIFRLILLNIDLPGRTDALIMIPPLKLNDTALLFLPPSILGSAKVAQVTIKYERFEKDFCPTLLHMNTPSGKQILIPLVAFSSTNMKSRWANP